MKDHVNFHENHKRIKLYTLLSSNFKYLYCSIIEISGISLVIISRTIQKGSGSNITSFHKQFPHLLVHLLTFDLMTHRRAKSVHFTMPSFLRLTFKLI